MIGSYQLKSLQPCDYKAVREVYVDAIESQGEGFYTKEQIQAWAALAWLPGILDTPLAEGSGWVSFENQTIAAFAVRYPVDRLALLYCRGCFARRGHASFLLNHVEAEALGAGQTHLVAEASCFSYPLLLRRGWQFLGTERVELGGVIFDRFRLNKIFLTIDE